MSPEEEKKTKKVASEELKAELRKRGHKVVNDMIFTEVLNPREMLLRRSEIRPVFANYLASIGDKPKDVNEVLNGYIEEGNRMILFKIRKNGKEEIIGLTTLLVDTAGKKARFNDSYLKEEYRGYGLGNRENIKRAALAMNMGIPEKGIIAGFGKTKSGRGLQARRPEMVKRVYEAKKKIEAEQEIIAKKSASSIQSDLSVNFKKEREEKEARELEKRKLEKEKVRAEKTRKLIKKGSRRSRY